MAAGHSRRDRCAAGANTGHTFAALIALFVVGCFGRDDVASGPPGSGVGGDNGGATGSTISCNPTGTGCLCIVDDTQPGQLTACSPTSVAANAMEQGVCCVAQSLCTCTRYTCRSDPSSSYCTCGSVAILTTVTLGSPVAECPTPAPGKKCCFSQDNASCICSGLACGPEEIEVANCSAAAAGVCANGEAIDKCR